MCVGFLPSPSQGSVMADAEVDQEKIHAIGSVKSAALSVIEFLAIAALFFGLVQIALSLSPNTVTAFVWPPSGFALAVILLQGNRIWPAILAGSFSPYVFAGYPISEASLIAIGTLVAGLAGASLTKRWSTAESLFTTARGVAIFSFIAFLPVAVISSAAVLGASVVAKETDLASSVVQWATLWLADGTATLIITPVILLWVDALSASFTKRAFFEALATFILTAVIGLVAFSPVFAPERVPIDVNFLTYRSFLGFFIFVPLLLAGLAGNRRNVAMVAFIFWTMALWGFSASTFPFSQNDLTAAQLLLFAVSISISLPPLILSTAIATRRNSEAQLMDSRKLLEQQLESTSSELGIAKRHFEILTEGVVEYAIFVLDTGGHIASWNSSAQKIMGYTTEEVVGKHFGIFFRPDERRTGEPNRALEGAIKRGKHEVEGWRMRKNGTPFFVTGLISSIHDDAGNLLGFANVLRDATERRDAQEKLVEAREQLAMAQKMEAIGKLTGGIAHDFNNLLMIIGGNAQIFQRLLDPKLPRAIEAIQTAAKRGESLTRQLLTFSRRQHLSPAVVDLNAAIKNMRTMIESSLRGNIVYKEELDEGVSAVKLDLAELELAIVNISVNARDAMPNGGTFTLSINTVTGEDEISKELEGRLVAIVCSDTGMGIPPNLLSKIFDPFFTTKEVGKGSGLGLSQVYGFAHQAGGTVKAQSKVGLGTTISVYLPSADVQIAKKEPPAKKSDQPQRPSVLIVDDSAEVAEVTSSLFEQLGYATVYRDSAEEALSLLANGAKIDLVFSDIVMPGAIDGVGLAQEIRSRYPKLPVVLTTGYSDAAQAAPPDLRILRKPFDTDTLREFVQNIGQTSLTNDSAHYARRGRA
jgi:PAS domain S-box-containing protein